VDIKATTLGVVPSRTRPEIAPGQQWAQAGVPVIRIIGLARRTVPDTTLWLVRGVGKRDAIMSEGYIWVHFELSRSGSPASCDLV